MVTHKYRIFTQFPHILFRFFIFIRSSFVHRSNYGFFYFSWSWQWAHCWCDRSAGVLIPLKYLISPLYDRVCSALSLLDVLRRSTVCLFFHIYCIKRTFEKIQCSKVNKSNYKEKKISVGLLNFLLRFIATQALEIVNTAAWYLSWASLWNLVS